MKTHQERLLSLTVAARATTARTRFYGLQRSIIDGEFILGWRALPALLVQTCIGRMQRLCQRFVSEAADTATGRRKVIGGRPSRPIIACESRRMPSMETVPSPSLRQAIINSASTRAVDTVALAMSRASVCDYFEDLRGAG